MPEVGAGDHHERFPQMRGIITGSDRFVIALKGDGRLQMIYKHAISTIVLTEERS